MYHCTWRDSEGPLLAQVPLAPEQTLHHLCQWVKAERGMQVEPTTMGKTAKRQSLCLFFIFQLLNKRFHLSDFPTLCRNDSVCKFAHTRVADVGPLACQNCN